MSNRIASWSNALPTTTHLADYGDALARENRARPFIARGAGRSYSDAAYVTEGVTLSSRRLTAIGPLDEDNGIICCEAGASMVDLHERLEHTPFSFPVYGGTQWATVGGGVASDIHGKNHVDAGSFGCHVEAITLETAGNTIVRCSREAHAELFAATLGGMGLTGVIRSVELRLERGRPRAVRSQSHFVADISAAPEFLDADDSDFCLCGFTRLQGPGVGYRASYVDRPAPPPAGASNLWLPRLPVMNGWTLAAADLVRRIARRDGTKIVHARRFNYSAPHEYLVRWNNLYGRRGMIEYHVAVPERGFAVVVTTLLDASQGITGGL